MQPHLVSAEIQVTGTLSDGSEVELDVPLITLDEPDLRISFDEVYPDRDFGLPRQLRNALSELPKTYLDMRVRVRPINPHDGVLFTVKTEVPMTPEERITFLERALESAIVTLEAPGDHVDRSRRGAETAEALRARLERSRRA